MSMGCGGPTLMLAKLLETVLAKNELFLKEQVVQSDPRKQILNSCHVK